MIEMQVHSNYMKIIQIRFYLQTLYFIQKATLFFVQNELVHDNIELHIVIILLLANVATLFRLVLGP